jgi:hypothetical protein
VNVPARRSSAQIPESVAFDKGKTEYDNQLAKMEQKKKASAELRESHRKRKLGVWLNQIKANLATYPTAPADGMVIYGTTGWKIQVGDREVVVPLVRLPDLKEMEVLAPGQRRRPL